MIVHSTSTTTPPSSYKKRGSAQLVLIITCVIIAGLFALVNAQMIQTSFGSLSSSNIALQAQQYASAKADIIKATAYDDLESQSKEKIQNSNDFWDAVELSPEKNYSADIKQRTATVNIYRGSELEPRYSLKVLRLSREVKASGVPIGTVIIWPSANNPTDGIWLLCNGQSCSAYPELVKVLGKSTVPNYQGVFLRGYGSQVSTHYGTVIHSSDTLGVIQGDTIRNITGSFPMGVDSWSGYEGVFYQGNHSSHLVGDDDGYKNYSTYINLSRGTPTANEIRPINIAVKYLIRAA